MASKNEMSEPTTAPREPCPCGSGRRFKACHGRAAVRAEHTRVLRPFDGLAGEADWIAMRELVPAATSELTLTGEYASMRVKLATVLPMAWPAQVADDGTVMLAAQTQTSSGDVARDMGDALRQALALTPGDSVPPRPVPADAPRIQDLVDVSVAPRVIVHSGFDFWFDGTADVDAATKATLERANAAASPTARLATVEAAYWMQLGDRTQLRWVLAEPEEKAINGLARMLTDGLGMGDGSRYLGSFRSMGLLVPVWDLPDGATVEDVEESAAEFRKRLDDAVADTSALSGAERRARESLRARQLTLH
ncbi:MAG TPA: DUF5926 family protein [Actinomycetes bacterium]|nr:DUF5926 family protein [Actinomycetes bacterium]